MFSAILIAFFVTTVSCDTLIISQPGHLESGAVSVESPITEAVASTPSAESTSASTIPASSNSTTVTPVTSGAPVTVTTENEEAVTEKTVTEQIRTYIEDSVKSVKKAISKIGKFVGDLFEEASANSTSTVVPVSTASPVSTLSPTNATSLSPK